eukprot:CAMPEP_0182918460 /NCGR_PEP_ID=MMETSP0105_2-20130417/2111_1 /TAXON_ID=81532 ORGANISM="Acanthoeca-like sp., Strain 10tr" /NCGR_SAMPLE_ID=MMETSP0105_2 /ASSEMBLY_ACC=CAM_ASM_000205 /LENGTH=61 /DNA_ID=CAMNT_0025055551 /DNA_START=140 /DNA_END=325 /DNA_ORIENTATION=-
MRVRFGCFRNLRDFLSGGDAGCASASEENEVALSGVILMLVPSSTLISLAPLNLPLALLAK